MLRCFLAPSPSKVCPSHLHLPRFYCTSSISGPCRRAVLTTIGKERRRVGLPFFVPLFLLEACKKRACWRLGGCSGKERGKETMEGAFEKIKMSVENRANEKRQKRKAKTQEAKAILVHTRGADVSHAYEYTQTPTGLLCIQYLTGPGSRTQTQKKWCASHSRAPAHLLFRVTTLMHLHCTFLAAGCSKQAGSSK